MPSSLLFHLLDLKAEDRQLCCSTNKRLIRSILFHRTRLEKMAEWLRIQPLWGRKLGIGLDHFGEERSGLLGAVALKPVGYTQVMRIKPQWPSFFARVAKPYPRQGLLSSAWTVLPPDLHLLLLSHPSPSPCHLALYVKLLHGIQNCEVDRETTTLHGHQPPSKGHGRREHGRGSRKQVQGYQTLTKGSRDEEGDSMERVASPADRQKLRGVAGCLGRPDFASRAAGEAPPPPPRRLRGLPLACRARSAAGEGRGGGRGRLSRSDLCEGLDSEENKTKWTRQGRPYRR
ncbi:unnamed protein product [Rangifer tarandus platyrhynchus]|uniref:Uncharacterized protein n=2 Tax=Rangifer tarandus platyrhynchus TaxID=3082113 RepID=A0ABN8YYS1_RANTA|nr:unnamed protein product [Rangifer tarandus platyrhynchus]CAI9693945.1 unnamed protein product [Rangifer tarandus platyrhynchus]